MDVDDGATAETGVLTLPAKLRVVKAQAFYGDKSVKSVELPYGATRIESKAFASSGVTTVRLPETLTYIAGDAFDGAPLKTVYAQIGTAAYDWATGKGYTVVDNSSPASDFTYRVTSSADKTCTVTGYTGTAAEVRVPHVINGYRVTQIGSGAFENCATVKSVTVPNSVTALASCAFEQASALTDVFLPDSVTGIGDSAFSRCSALKTVRLPQALTVLPDSIFAECTSLTRFDVPASVTEIGENAFIGCSALAAVNLNSRLKTIGGWAFRDCSALKRIDVPDGVTTIGGSAFGFCAAMTGARLPGTVTSLGGGVFIGCEALTDVSLNESLTVIESSMFSNCKALKSIRIPTTVREIGDYAFEGCTTLTTMNIPDSVTTISYYAFCDCEALKSLTLSANLTEIGDHAFYNCRSLTSATLPGKVKTLGEYAFYDCVALTQVSLPATLTSLPKGAFYNCKALTSVTLREGLAAIGESAFERCDSLRQITLPSTVTTIGALAFGDSGGELVFKGNAPTIAGNALNNGYFIAVYPHARSGWASAIAKTYGASWICWQADNASSVADSPLDATEALNEAVTKNENRQNYSTHSLPIHSYLISESDGGFTRVEYPNASLSDENGNVYIERYDKNRKLLWKKTLQTELPLFGGFFSGAKYNFFVFGQEKLNNDNSREIMRVVRYTKNWHRVDSLSAYGEDTCYPFISASLRMAESGDFLYIHTNHTMYSGHQANMSFQIYVPAMQFVRKHNALNTVSHSFNQFVKVDGGDLLLVDHGDAFPRAVVFMRISGVAGTVNSSDTEGLYLLRISGNTGNNYTGVSVGGLEVSGTRYLVAGNSVDQSRFDTSRRRNIFVAAADKANLTQSGVTFRWITTYGDSDTRTITTPMLVKLSDAKFLLMWAEQAAYEWDDDEPPWYLRYVFLNGQGATTSKIYSAQGSLSDCQPVVSGGKVTWYVTKDSKPVFYTLDPNHPETITKK